MSKLQILDPVAPLLTIEAVQSFRNKQAARLAQVNQLVTDAEARILKIQKQVAPPAHATGSDRAYLAEAARITARPQILSVRQSLDDAALPIVREANAAADLAKTYAERHWDRFSVLRRATSGNGTDPGARQNDLVRRASLMTLLKEAGGRALTDWAQQAVDQADLLLADVVCLVNGNKKLSDQPFGNADFLAKLPLREYDEAQGLLKDTIMDAERVGLRYSEFQRGTPNSTARIALGLAARQRAQDAAGGNLLDKRLGGEQV